MYIFLNLYNTVLFWGFIYIYITFTHLADAFIQSDLQLHSGYTFSLVCVFPGNRTHNLLRCWRNALPLSHTGTRNIYIYIYCYILHFYAIYFCNISRQKKNKHHLDPSVPKRTNHLSVSQQECTGGQNVCGDTWLFTCTDVCLVFILSSS